MTRSEVVFGSVEQWVEEFLVSCRNKDRIGVTGDGDGVEGR